MINNNKTMTSSKCIAYHAYLNTATQKIKTWKLQFFSSPYRNLLFRGTFPYITYIIMQIKLATYTNDKEFKPSTHCSSTNPELNPAIVKFKWLQNFYLKAWKLKLKVPKHYKPISTKHILSHVFLCLQSRIRGKWYFHSGSNTFLSLAWTWHPWIRQQGFSMYRLKDWQGKLRIHFS